MPRTITALAHVSTRLDFETFTMSLRETMATNADACRADPCTGCVTPPRAAIAKANQHKVLS